jgi:hypothetical protein
VCAAAIHEVDSVEPKSDARVYTEGHRIYQSLYPALKDVYAALARYE